MQKKNTVGFIYSPNKSSSTLETKTNSVVKLLSINDLDRDEEVIVPPPTL